MCSCRLDSQQQMAPVVGSPRLILEPVLQTGFIMWRSWTLQACILTAIQKSQALIELGYRAVNLISVFDVKIWNGNASCTAPLVHIYNYYPGTLFSIRCGFNEAQMEKTPPRRNVPSCRWKLGIRGRAKLYRRADTEETLVLTWWSRTGRGRTVTWAAQHPLRCCTQSSWGSWRGCRCGQSWRETVAASPGSVSETRGGNTRGMRHRSVYLTL